MLKVRVDVQRTEVDVQTAKRECKMVENVMAHNGNEAYRLDNTIGLQIIRCMKHLAV